MVAYQLAAALSDELHAVVRSWSVLDQRTCGGQLLRAIDSVGANIAESSGRWHDGEKHQLLIVARGSLVEAEHWLVRAEARDLLPAGTSDRVDEIARTLNGLIKRAGASACGGQRPAG